MAEVIAKLMARLGYDALRRAGRRLGRGRRALAGRRTTASTCIGGHINFPAGSPPNKDDPCKRRHRRRRRERFEQRREELQNHRAYGGHPGHPAADAGLRA